MTSIEIAAQKYGDLADGLVLTSIQCLQAKTVSTQSKYFHRWRRVMNLALKKLRAEKSLEPVEVLDLCALLIRAGYNVCLILNDGRHTAITTRLMKEAESLIPPDQYHVGQEVWLTIDSPAGQDQRWCKVATTDTHNHIVMLRDPLGQEYGPFSAISGYYLYPEELADDTVVRIKIASQNHTGTGPSRNSQEP